MAEVPISGPLGEADLAHQHRLEPDGRLLLGGSQAVAPGTTLALGDGLERGLHLSERFGPFDELPDLAVAEPRAHLGRITELALLVIADN
jgi:hypothetical protein